MPCIQTIITSHFKMFFRDVLNKQFNKFNRRKRFFNVSIIFMTVVMESYISAVIGVNTRKNYNRPAKIAADIFGNSRRIGKSWLSINIKAVFVFIINEGLYFAERGTDMFV